MLSVSFQLLQPEHFIQVINLGNKIHGDNYLNLVEMESLYEKSFQNSLNASVVALQGDTLVGFRLTIAPQHWAPDNWCSPAKWAIPVDQVCYFKCNTVDLPCQGQGIGPKMLNYSIRQSQLQGALAGLAHIWLASPNNSAYRYFKKCGGVLIKKHPNRWQTLSKENHYHCPVCGSVCSCTAAEMLLKF